MTFWNYFWLLVWGFFLFMFLMLVFQVFADIFRDRTLGGGAKALWTILLIVFPPVTVLVYLITRGRGMGGREQTEVQQRRDATEDYIRSVAQPASPADQISTAKTLLDNGSITAVEFDQIKTQALA